MFEKPDTTTVSVGVATKPYPSWRLPGWNRYSVGYFSDNGCKYFSSPFNGKPYGLSFNHGDVIGVGYRHRTGTLFFTRNGRKLDDAYNGLRWNLFPTIGANGPCQVHVNLGQAGFVFVEANVKKWGLAPSQGTLAPPPAYGLENDTILLAAGNSSSSSSSTTTHNTAPPADLIRLDDPSSDEPHLTAQPLTMPSSSSSHPPPYPPPPLPPKSSSVQSSSHAAADDDNATPDDHVRLQMEPTDHSM
jgi:hypothetical protein